MGFPWVQCHRVTQLSWVLCKYLVTSSERDRATEAATMLNILNGASRPFMPFRDPPVTYMPGIPAFAPNPSHYSVVPTDNQSPDPEGIAGPSHTVHADDLEISEDK